MCLNIFNSSTDIEKVKQITLQIDWKFDGLRSAFSQERMDDSNYV